MSVIDCFPSTIAGCWLNSSTARVLSCCPGMATCKGEILLMFPYALRGLLAQIRRGHFFSWLKTAFFLLFLTGATWLHAATVSGTVKDPSGAVISQAKI